MTLLTEHILTAPAIWLKTQSLQTPLQILSAFASATFQQQTKRPFGPPSGLSLLSQENWVKAVTKGVSGHSAKWKHLLVLCGLLLGFKKDVGDRKLPASARTIEMTLVHVVNIILSDKEEQNWWSTHVIPLIIGSVFSILSKEAKIELHHEMLIPLIIRSTFFSDAALNHGYFLSAIDLDVVQDEGNKFHWRLDSLTYGQVRYLSTSPLVGLLGALSHVVAYSVTTIDVPDLLDTVTLDLLTFCKSLDIQWRQNKLSEIDAREEDQFLVQETRSSTLPILWHLLQSVGFAVVVTLRSLVETLVMKITTPRDTG